jgi:hypothetical protein
MEYSGDRGWGHLPEFWADTGLLNLNPADILRSLHPAMKDQAAQLMDDILTPVPLNINLVR